MSWLVFGLSLFATLLAWRFFVVSIDGNAKNAFDDLLLAFTGELERSMTAYEQVLSGAASLVQTNPTISRRDFRRYLDVVQVARRYPGQQGIGYSVMFPKNQLATVEQRIREEGFENFKVTPQGNRQTYSAIIFIEPFDWRNKRAFGYDMYSEPVRRTAMARARDTGLPAASGAVKLVQETKSDVQAGFLLYLPIYSGFEMPNTVEERRQTIKGFVYSPFRIGNLVEAVLKRERLDIKSNADIRITAPVIGEKTAVIFDDAKDSGDENHQAKFVQKGFLELYGVRWDIALASTPKFERAVDYTPAWAALFVGLTLSVLLSGLVGSAALRQHEANMSNARMELLTRELAHRVKNSLAVVQSVANRSLVDGRPLKEARELFLQRLHALARAHSHLVNNSWRGVSMRELAAAELQPFGARASIHGPDVSMNANTAQMFALVLHELATNAVKHGALSVPAGRVDLRWRIDPVDGEDTLRFRWKEAGGPAVKEPESSGFGQTLLKQSIAHGGLSRPEIAYEKDGLRYEFEVPLARLEEETSLRSSKQSGARPARRQLTSVISKQKNSRRITTEPAAVSSVSPAADKQSEGDRHVELGHRVPDRRSGCCRTWVRWHRIRIRRSCAVAVLRLHYHLCRNADHASVGARNRICSLDKTKDNKKWLGTGETRFRAILLFVKDKRHEFIRAKPVPSFSAQKIWWTTHHDDGRPCEDSNVCALKNELELSMPFVRSTSIETT